MREKVKSFISSLTLSLSQNRTRIIMRENISKEIVFYGKRENVQHSKKIVFEPSKHKTS